MSHDPNAPPARPPRTADGNHIHKTRAGHAHKHKAGHLKHSRKKEAIHLAKHGLVSG